MLRQNLGESGTPLSSCYAADYGVGMSQLEGKLPLDLRGGFAWFGVITIPEQPRAEPKVIFECGSLAGGPRVSVQVAAEGLSFDVLDVKGQRFRAGPVKDAYFLGKAILLLCGLAREPDGTHRVVVAVNGEELVSAPANGDWGTAAEFPSSIGADLHGEHAAVFTLAEMGALSMVPPKPDLDKLKRYAVERYHL